MYPRPLTFDSPILTDVQPIVDRSQFVTTNLATIALHAEWLSQEPMDFTPLAAGVVRPGATIDSEVDMSMTISLLNFAFTDFSSSTKFTANYQGRDWSDSEGLMVCLNRALDEGIPVTSAAYLAEVTVADLESIFVGNIAMPMLPERVRILHTASRVLLEQYGGSWSNFLDDCGPLLFDEGRGAVERLVSEFPRFDDAVNYHGHTARIYKLAQLTFWSLHSQFADAGRFQYEDIGRISAFADYILPLGLRSMGIFHYAPELEAAINRGVPLARDSDEEIELRAHTIYAVAMLTEEVNRRRPAHAQVLMARVDGRLWTAFHASFRPHHLTVTTMY
jgi:hypothetical protein